MHVLIVDDREENLYLLQALMQGNGWQVDQAHHGAEALAMARQAPPDIVVSDLLMPVMDGYTLLRHWKSDAHLRDIPFVVYTATYTESADEKLALDLGADAFIVKPAEPDAFMAGIGEVLVMARRGKLEPPQQPIDDDESLMGQYSKVLVHKLEAKTEELENTNRQLQAELAGRCQAEESLRASEANLAAAQALARIGSWECDLASRVGAWSEEMYMLFGRDPALGPPPCADFRDWIHPLDRGQFELLHAQALAQEKKCQQEFRIVLAEADSRWVDCRCAVESDADGHPLRLTGTVQDITERKRTENKLKLAAKVFEHAGEGILIADAAGIIVEVNDTFTAITGYNREEAIGQSVTMLHSSAEDADFHAMRWLELNKQNIWHGEISSQRKSGETYAELNTITAVRDSNGNVEHYVSLFTDITPMKEYKQQLEHMVHFDHLTSLPNRVLLADRLLQGMLQSQRRSLSLAVIYLDLDGFKAVNDHHGHNIGDALLCEIAQRMKSILREGDTLARIGGDEFVIVLVDLVQPSDCELVLKRLLRAIDEPVAVGDVLLHVSASMGVTLHPQDGSDPDLLLRHADQAMYLAKQAGKNCYHYFDVAQDAAEKNLRENRDHIRHALVRREFVLFYQPKVNMRTGEMIGAEALIRWQHPDRGLLPPIAFLPMIENHPISVDIGEWVIDEALTQMAAWRTKGLDIAVSVNVGALQLQRSDFMDTLTRLLAAHPDVPPERLELEILETNALEDVVQVSAIMLACQAINIRFALDDFGTGYSSLTYLRRLPAELLKIDLSFVRNMLKDSEDRSIVEAVIGLAMAFNRGVIAEGVETEDHGNCLLGLGCELGQGYGIARPMPAAELPAWVATWRPHSSWTNGAILD